MIQDKAYIKRKLELGEKRCQYCGISVYSVSHRCSGKKAFDYGRIDMINILSKLMVYDEIEDCMSIDKEFWDNLKWDFTTPKIHISAI